MLPIRLIETEREDFDGPIVEFWRDDTFIGMAFWDGEAPIVQIYPDGDGDVHDLDVRELQMLLDTTTRIIDPDAFDEEMEELRAASVAAVVMGGEHPATVQLLAEFDAQAVYRTDDGEGFFPRTVVEPFVNKCEELDLAVTEFEALAFDGQGVTPRPDLVLEVPDQEMMTWSQFRTFANSTVLNALTTWPDTDDLVFAFVFRQPDGEDIVA